MPSNQSSLKLPSSSTKKICHYLSCKGEAKKICTSCRSAFYCSKECQEKDWHLQHQVKCKEIIENIPIEKKIDKLNLLQCNSDGSSAITRNVQSIGILLGNRSNNFGKLFMTL